MLNQFRLNTTVYPPPPYKSLQFFSKNEIFNTVKKKNLHHHTSVKIFFINFGIYKLSKTRGENIFFGGKSLQSIKNYDDSDTFIGLFRLDLAPSLFNPGGGGHWGNNAIYHHPTKVCEFIVLKNCNQD